MIFFSGYQIRLDNVLEEDAPFDICSCQVSDSFVVVDDKLIFFLKFSIVCFFLGYTFAFTLGIISGNDLSANNLTNQIPCLLVFGN